MGGSFVEIRGHTGPILSPLLCYLRVVHRKSPSSFGRCGRLQFNPSSKTFSMRTKSYIYPSDDRIKTLRILSAIFPESGGTKYPRVECITGYYLRPVYRSHRFNLIRRRKSHGHCAQQTWEGPHGSLHSTRPPSGSHYGTPRVST